MPQSAVGLEDCRPLTVVLICIQIFVWIDLIAPSQEEQQWVLDAYSQNLPTLKSLEDISSSARFYRDDDGILHISTYFLTKNKNYQVDGETEDHSSILATVQTVAFILHKERLFTLRGEKLVAFRAFRARARRNDYEIDYKDPTWVLLGLLEAKLDQLADILEDIHKDLEKYSTEVLNNRHREQILDLDDMITRLAQLEDMLGKAQLCLIDLRRVLTFLARPRALGSHIYDADIRELSEDVRSLVEHDAFLFQKVRFLLDTTSGFINTEQNDTIRRFSNSYPSTVSATDAGCQCLWHEHRRVAFCQRGHQFYCGQYYFNWLLYWPINLL